MKVLISDLFVGDCKLTQKTGVEVVRIRLDESQPESVIAAAELLRLLRFTKKQNEKVADASARTNTQPSIKSRSSDFHSKGEME
jgi:hypothetical protein